MREAPGALERISQANHDYNTVVRFMERRVLLPQDRGVQWNYRGQPKVLFSFRKFNYHLPRLDAALDVTTGQRLSQLHGTLRTQRAHTYLLYLQSKASQTL